MAQLSQKVYGFFHFRLFITLESCHKKQNTASVCFGQLFSIGYSDLRAVDDGNFLNCLFFHPLIHFPLNISKLQGEYSSAEI